MAKAVLAVVSAMSLVLAANSLLAAPAITVNRVQQRYPWNNVVDIDYTVSGIEGYAEDYRVDVEVSAVTNAVAFTVTASNFLNCAYGDLTSSNGTWRASWNASADGVDFISNNATVELKLVYCPIAASEAEYMVIYLSSGSSSSCYPVRYLRAMPAKLFNIDEYKGNRMVFKRVKSGTYKIGNPVADVNIANDFFAGLFEVTQTQYKKVMNANPSVFNTDADGNRAAYRPVDSVPGDAAGENKMAWKLSQKAMYRGTVVSGFNKPTKNQWECVTRAGTSTTCYWGGSTSLYAAYSWISFNAGGTTHEVGQKEPNAWGFYDTTGNVSEWTAYFDGNSSYHLGGASITSNNADYTRSNYFFSYPTWLTQNYFGYRFVFNLPVEE